MSEKYLELAMKTEQSKIYETQQNSSKQVVDSYVSLPQKTRIYQTNNLTLHLKELEKEQTKSKVSRRKEIIKIRKKKLPEITQLVGD